MAKRKTKGPNRRESRIIARNAGRVSRETPYARLKRMSTLSVYELTAADELIAAHAMANGVVASRDPDLFVPGEARAGAADAAMAKRCDLVEKYRQWRADLVDTQPGRVAVDALFHERTLRQIDGEQRWKTGKARKHLVTALRHFAALRGNVPNGVRDWKWTG